MLQNNEVKCHHWKDWTWRGYGIMHWFTESVMFNNGSRPHPSVPNLMFIYRFLSLDAFGNYPEDNVILLFHFFYSFHCALSIVFVSITVILVIYFSNYMWSCNRIPMINCLLCIWHNVLSLLSALTTDLLLSCDY